MKDLIAKLHSSAAYQILATFSTLEMQLQGFAKSSYEKDLRIAELEAQIAAKADTDKLREAIHKLQFEDAETDYKDGYNRGVRAAAELIGSTALQAPVREVPEGWALINVAALRDDLAEQRDTTETYGDICGSSVSVAISGCIETLDEYMDAALPAAPVQQDVIQQPQDERAAFEAWASDPVRSSKLPLGRWPTNDAYVDHRTYTAFYGWLARAAIAKGGE